MCIRDRSETDQVWKKGQTQILCWLSKRQTGCEKRTDTNLVLIIRWRQTGCEKKEGQTQIFCWLLGGDRLGVNKSIDTNLVLIIRQRWTNLVLIIRLRQTSVKGQTQMLVIRHRQNVTEDRDKSHADYNMSITDSTEIPFHSHSNNNNKSNLRERWTQIKPKPKPVLRATFWAKWEGSWVREDFSSFNFCFVFLLDNIY